MENLSVKTNEGLIYRKGHWITKPDGSKVWWESPALWIRFKHRGRYYSESSGTADLNEAIQLLKDRVQGLSAGRKTVKEDKLKFEDLSKLLLLDYKINQKRSLASAELSIKNLAKFFSGYKAVEIRQGDVMEYIAARQKDGLTNASINRELSALKRMFSLAKRGEDIVYGPYIPMLEENNVRQGFVNHGDFLRLVDGLPEYLKDFVRFLYLTGLRVGAARGLEHRHVDLENQVIHLPSDLSKNKHGQTIPLTGELLELVKRNWNNRSLDCPYLFHNNGIKIGDFRKAWDTACVRAGLGHFEKVGEKKVYVGTLIHDLRRSAVRNMLRSGVREKEAMMLSGHRTRSVFDRYNIVSEDDLKAASERLQTFLAEQDTTAKVVSVNKP